MDAAAATSDEADLWRRLRAGADPGARDRLLEIHLPYARVVARVLYARRHHEEIPFDDYFQLASLGMVEAVDRYDPERGVQFRTFAARRMQGAILNGLERMTEKQQQIAARQRLRAERLQDVAALADDDAGERRRPEALMQFVGDVGIGLAVCWMLEGTAMVEDASAVRSIPFYQGVAARELRARLLEAVEALPPPERTVIRSHYLQEVPFEDVAATLALSKGRVSQLHRQALGRLRVLVRDHADWNATF